MGWLLAVVDVTEGVGELARRMAATRTVGRLDLGTVLAERDQLADRSRSSRLCSQYKKFCLQ